MRILFAIFLSISTNLKAAETCTDLHNSFEAMGDQDGRLEDIVYRILPDLDGDGKHDFEYASARLCGATGNCNYFVMLSNKGCPRVSGQVSGSSLLVLPSATNGVRDLIGYMKSGCAGRSGTLTRYEFANGVYGFTKQEDCDCEVKKDRPKNCPPWKDEDKRLVRSKRVFLRTTPVYEKVRKEDFTIQVENRGKIKGTGIKTLSLPTGSPEVKKEWATSWAQASIKYFNRDKSKSDLVDWLENWTKITPIKDKYKIVQTALIESGGGSYGLVQFSTKQSGVVYGEKMKIELMLLGVVLLDGARSPVEVKNVFAGLVNHGEADRVISPMFFADVNEDGFLDILLKDVRRYGRKGLTLYLNDKSHVKKGPLKIESIERIRGS